MRGAMVRYRAVEVVQFIYCMMRREVLGQDVANRGLSKFLMSHAHACKARVGILAIGPTEFFTEDRMYCMHFRVQFDSPARRARGEAEARRLETGLRMWKRDEGGTRQ